LIPALRRYCGLALTLLLSCAGVTAQTAPVSALSSAAFYYGEQPPLSDLQAFDIAVVEPDHVRHPAQRSRSGDSGRHELFAYVSLGEVHSTRDYYKQLPAGSLRTENAAWNSSVIDQTAPGWSEFFLSKIIAPLWEKAGAVSSSIRWTLISCLPRPMLNARFRSMPWSPHCANSSAVIRMPN